MALNETITPTDIRNQLLDVTARTDGIDLVSFLRQADSVSAFDAGKFNASAWNVFNASSFNSLDKNKDAVLTREDIELASDEQLLSLYRTPSHTIG
jgi:hypothetical protein